jgi:hypothetical protein
MMLLWEEGEAFDSRQQVEVRRSMQDISLLSAQLAACSCRHERLPPPIHTQDSAAWSSQHACHLQQHQPHCTAAAAEPSPNAQVAVSEAHQVFCLVKGSQHLQEVNCSARQERQGHNQLR